MSAVTDRVYPAVPKKPRRRRWRRIFLWALLAVVVLRGLLALLLPTILNQVAHGFGLQCSVESLRLWILAGDVEIRGLRLDEYENGKVGKNVAKLDYLMADVAPGSLLRGRPRVERVEVDGLTVSAERDRSGVWNLARMFGPKGGNGAAAAAPAPAPAPATASAPKGSGAADAGEGLFDPRPPIEVHALRIENVALSLRDATVDPPLEAQIVVDVRVSDFGVEGVPASALVRVSSPQFLDSLRVDADAFGNDGKVSGRVDVRVHGFQPKKIETWLRPLGFAPLCEAWAFRFGATVALQGTQEKLPNGKTTNRFPASLQAAIRDVGVTADLTVPFHLDEITAAARVESWDRIADVDAAIRGVTAAIEERRSGGLAALGFELVPVPAAPAAPVIPKNPPAGTPFVLELRELSITDVAAELRDLTLDPPATWNAAIERVRVTHLSTDPKKSSEPAAIDALFHAPGIVENIALEGTAAPLGEEIAVDLTLRADGIGPDCLAPYLGKVGIRTDLQDGGFGARIEARVRPGENGKVAASARLTGIGIGEDASHEDLLSVKTISVDGLTFDPKGPAIAIGSLAVTDFYGSLSLDKDGGMRVPGARIGGGAGPAEREILVPLRVASFDAKDLSLGIPGAPPGTIRAKVSIAEKIDSIEETATISVPSLDPPQLSAKGSFTLAGIRGEALAALTRASGVSPGFATARVAGSYQLEARNEKGAWLASLQVRDVDASAGATRLAAVEAIDVDGVSVSPGAIGAASISIRKPQLSAEREPTGELRVAGMRFVRGSAGATTQPVARSKDAAPPESAPAAASPSISIPKIRVADASLAWRDRSVTPHVDTVLRARLGVDDFSLGAGAKSFRVDAQLASDGVVDEARLQAQVSLDPSGRTFDGQVSVQGLREGWLLSYLPPGARLELADGRFQMEIHAENKPLPDGAHSARLELRNAELADGRAPRLRFERFLVNAPKLDPARADFAIEELSLAGLDLSVERSEDAIRMLGLSFGPGGARASIHEAVEAAASRPSIRALVGSSDLPTVRLARLALGLKKLAVSDSRPGKEPFAILGNLTNEQPLVVDSSLEAQAPLLLRWKGTAAPAVAEVDLQLSLDPFDAMPSFELGLRLAGIHGDALAHWVPKLSARFEPDALKEGELSLRARVALQVRRDGPLSFDLSSGFGADLTVEKVRFAGAPDGPPLVGFDFLHVDAPLVDPKKGRIQIRRIEIENPKGSAWIDGEGLHAAAFLIPKDSDGGAAESGSSPAVAAAPPPVTPPAAVTPEAVPLDDGAPPKPQRKEIEVRIDDLSVTGIDFEFRDLSGTPPLVVPLNGLDFALQRFSTRTFREEFPFRFSLSLNAGNVGLPKRVESSSLLAGIASGAANLVTLQSDKDVELQQRPLFDEISVSGQMNLAPPRRGWVRVGVSSLELLGFRGPAAASGVTIGDGLFDGTVQMAFRGDEGLSIQTRSTFRHLSLSESSGGPISTYLKLPMPLDAVLFLLRDESGQQRLSFGVHISDAGVSTGAIAAESAKALGEAIANAIARAPLRVLRSVTDVAGVTGGESQESFHPVLVRFEPAETNPPFSEWANAANLAGEMVSEGDLTVAVQHQFSAPDLAHVAELANPSRDECIEMSARLRQQRQELGQRRDLAAAEARALVFMGRAKDADVAAEKVRLLDRQIGDTESALDSFLGMTRRGAERRSDGRTRNAAVALARARLDQVRKNLEGSGVPADRIQLKPVRVEADPETERSTIRIQPRRER